LGNQSEARDHFIFLAVIGSANFFVFITSIEQWQPLRLPRLVAAASPVPLPRELNPAGPNMMLDPALPNLLLDPENVAKLELVFPGHEFASLLHSAKKFRDFKAPAWPLPLPPIQNEVVARFRKATKAELPEALSAMILLATEQLDQSKRMAQQVADVLNFCSELTRESQEVHDSLEALHKRLTAADASDTVVAIPYRISVQQMLTHLPAPGCSCFCLWPGRKRSLLDFYSPFAHPVPSCHIPHVG
jgi:hypothetical protein